MKRLLSVPVVAACVLSATPASAAPLAAIDASSYVSAKDDDRTKAKVKDKPRKDKSAKAAPGGSKGGNPPAHSNGKGRAQAPGQVGKSATSAGAATNADPRSENENQKITYCHVPPGNPANGHVITTSVNAIDPGHLNHPGDIIPPFSFVKHGETVSFPGQNWGPDAQAVIDDGCSAPTGTIDEGAATDGQTEAPGTDTPVAEQGEVAGVALTADGSVGDADRSFVDAILPDAGGARWGLLVAALALIGIGGALAMRRRRV